MIVFSIVRGITTSPSLSPFQNSDQKATGFLCSSSHAKIEVALASHYYSDHRKCQPRNLVRYHFHLRSQLFEVRCLFSPFFLDLYLSLDVVIDYKLSQYES